MVTGEVYYKQAEKVRYYGGPCGEVGRWYEPENNVFRLVCRELSLFDILICLMCIFLLKMAKVI